MLAMKQDKKLEKDLFPTDYAILRPTDTENEETNSIRCAILCSAKEWAGFSRPSYTFALNLVIITIIIIQ